MVAMGSCYPCTVCYGQHPSVLPRRRTQVLAAAVGAPQHALPVALVKLGQPGQAREVDGRHLRRCRAPCTTPSSESAVTKAQKMRLAFDTGKQRAKMMRERAVLCCDCHALQQTARRP